PRSIATTVVAHAIANGTYLGVRYILPMYVPFAIARATTVVAMLRGKRAMRFVASGLLVCQLGASVLAHPDYFPYFNAFAGRDPSRLLVDSNIDWGQDVLRLRGVIRREHIPSIALSLMGPADYAALGFPPFRYPSPWVPSKGWIAVSDHSYQMTKAQQG